MNKIEIEVPREIRYISEWLDFPLQQLSTGHCIVNKTITGCGYTHFCLTNNQPVILCSPRKFLLENKHEQLFRDYYTYLVINNGEKSLDIDGDYGKILDKGLSKTQKDHSSSDFEDFKEIQYIQNNLSTYLLECQVNGKFPKILVTYDSLKYVLSTLGELISNYLVIVDEFQNIFIDSRFKADTELNFMSTLQSCPNVTYLSATPYIEEYLDELDEFKDLPYYELKWHPDRLQTIKIEPRKSSRLSKEVDKIIQDYLNSRFPEKVNEETGEVCQSREVVFYTNSVKMITSTITRNNLTPDQVNIICADTDKNKRALDKISYSIGKAPLKGEPHKMFTFCTRTTYAGADFYSTNALSVIVSDCNIDSLATDIRMDFPQIMGRQRLKENVFRDECIFIYKLADNTITMEEFERISKEKLLHSEQDLRNFDAILHHSGDSSKGVMIMLEDLRARIKVFGYNTAYTGIDERTGTFAINKLVMISERRAFELRSNVYKSDVQIYNEFAKISSELSYDEYKKKVDKLEEIRDVYKSPGSFEYKIKSVCDILLDPFWYGKIYISDLHWLPLNHRNYLNYLGPERIKANYYREADIKKEMFSLKSGDSIKDTVISEFLIGQRYTLKEIKERIRIIYIKLEVSKTPKATDILEYFNVSEYSFLDKITKKRIRGYEIISLKE